LLDLIYTDVWGPSLVTFIGGTRYYVMFINDFSKRVWVYFLNQRYFKNSRSEKLWWRIKKGEW